MNIIPQKPPSFKALSQMGMHLIPMKPDGTKRPAVKWKDPESSEPDRFDEYTATFPQTTAWGLLCGRSGLLVIDIDRHGDSDGFEALGAVYLDLLLSDPLVVTTPSNGEHLFFRLPEGVTQRSVPGPKWHKGVDVKADKSYVLAPGSRTSKGVYQIASGSLDSIPTAPLWLLSELSELQTPQPVKSPGIHVRTPVRETLLHPFVHQILEEVSLLQETGRNSGLYYKTLLLVERGLFNDSVERIMIQAAEYCGLERGEIEETINSAKSEDPYND